ncbi:sugar-binding transcriptional regulator [uncultured Cohaesibacter sp.]|uniref:sugar-binding transcriptional regulator n=1 Tax=uncultured Cohaesibacter sp. TaxID=1002546 RepID=UPI0029C9285C|nr:sugar-binding transcriptional regulator [uncultured Cohaesibacter sp.]
MKSSSGKSASPAKSTASNGMVAPAIYQNDPRLWAAWLYYNDELNQNQIATLLGVSRATVVNYLQEARANHYIRISVRHDLLTSVNLAQKLKEIFGLRDCMVIPDDGGLLSPTQRIGKAGASFMEGTLNPDDVVGVAWGRTVQALADNLVEQSMSNLCVVQVMGSQSGATDGFSSEECVSLMSLKLRAKTAHLHAPATLSNKELRDALRKEAIIQEQFARIRSCTKLLFGVCSVKENSLVFASGLTNVEESKYYITKGAVGVICGRFYDGKGNWIEGPLDDRLMGISLDDVKNIPTRIAVAGGTEKTSSILGALRGGYINTLITDTKTALNILENLPSDLL